MFFEVEHILGFAYNKTPVRLTAVIDGVPPLATYTYSGPPFPLYDRLSDATPTMQLISGELTLIPEPATLGVLMLGSIPVLIRRNRNKRSKRCVRH